MRYVFKVKAVDANDNEATRTTVVWTKDPRVVAMNWLANNYSKWTITEITFKPLQRG